MLFWRAEKRPPVRRQTTAAHGRVAGVVVVVVRALRIHRKRRLHPTNEKCRRERARITRSVQSERSRRRGSEPKTKLAPFSCSNRERIGNVDDDWNIHSTRRRRFVIDRARILVREVFNPISEKSEGVHPPRDCRGGSVDGRRGESALRRQRGSREKRVRAERLLGEEGETYFRPVFDDESTGKSTTLAKLLLILHKMEKDLSSFESVDKAFNLKQKVGKFLHGSESSKST